MKKYYTYSDYENYKLTYGQVFRVVDLRKENHNTFTAWSEEQLQRLFEDGVIDDVNFRVMTAKSAEMGYSVSIADRRAAKDAESDEPLEVEDGVHYDEL